MQIKSPTLIPIPTNYYYIDEEFKFNDCTAILIDKSDQESFLLASYLSEKISKSTGKSLAIIDKKGSGEQNNFIALLTDNSKSSLGDEGYELSVSNKVVFLSAYKPSGLFHGIQTIRQLLPPEIEKLNGSEIQNLSLPGIIILDKPKFPWRGMLLDCCRHFMDKEFVKRYIDLLAYHKMNVLHWHLTEDQGWRIEIKKYPELTEVGAWRKNDDGTLYGGYYTQEDIREVVEYANSRYITIVPEIEMPGHSMAAITAYPQLSCTGGPFDVAATWGVFKDVYCAGNDSTFTFLEDVLTEVIHLFPGTYIHIGGDEVPKDRWNKCEKCQNRIESEGLGNEAELQSYFIKRIEKFLSSKGKRLVGWDEILEGGLPPEATVQSWRGMDGAITAVRSGHDAVVSPTSHAYFDYDLATTDLEKVYSFNPIPPVLTAEEQIHILGGECNMWTESAPQEKIDNKVFPRILAMAEVLWSANPDRNFDEFFQRVYFHYKRLEFLGVKFGSESSPLKISSYFNPDDLSINADIISKDSSLNIYYSTDGSTPSELSNVYSNTLKFFGSAKLKCKAFKNGIRYGETVEKEFIFHRALGLKPSFTFNYSDKYNAGGDFALTDGVKGSLNFRDGLWQGFEGDDIEAVLDLKGTQIINEISIGFIQDVSSWIFSPVNVEFYSSQDGVDFELIKSFETEVTKNPDVQIKNFNSQFEHLSARYIKITAKNLGTCPDWHYGAGGKAWIFADEIIIK
ncbi:MAG: family 20 glycosylhydrolase [Ignavibacteriales bacterium]|nr:family 20 glycosylhydrolase [Ignavibacteriales bacterium]